MSEPITVGDLVVVVRPGKHGNRDVGRYFTVSALKVLQVRCIVCDEIHPAELRADDGTRFWTRVVRLKRVPPLSELEGVSEEINAELWIENNVRMPA